MSGYEKPQDTIVDGKLPHLDRTAPFSYFDHFWIQVVTKHASTTTCTLIYAFVEYNAGRPSQAYSSLTEHNALRPSRDPMYLQYALPGAADPQLQQSSTAYDRQSDHMDYGASPLYQPRATLEATLSPYNNFETRKTSCNPERGTKGTVIYIYLDSTRDLLSPTPPNATLMFATHPVPASLTRFPAREQDVCYKYVVSATAPAFSETGSSNLKIPLNLQLQEPSRLDLDLIDIGPWQYEDDKQLEHRSSPQEVSRKRKTTDAPSDTLRSTKRATPSEQKNAHRQDYGSYPYLSASSANPPSLQSELNTMERKYTAYGRSQLQQSLQSESNTMGSQGLIGGLPSSQPPMRPPMGQTSPWNSSYGSRYLSGRNPQPNAAQSFQISSVSSPSPANPQLIRTSNLAPRLSRGATSAGSSLDGSFNPYTLYPNQAVLEVCGNLDAMQEQANWTPEERATKRRIVRFWREQNWATVKAYFKPVRVDEQPLPHERNERRINCIYWEERKRCYITSVDTISLLESLVTTKFGVDEKNRIRRNLQGYKPCTISKGKPESEDFFKLIMGLSDPKPRSIEKDVKVFEWSLLEQALNKVISKYVCSISLAEGIRITDLYQSADPASIARPLRKQPSSNFSGTPSEAGASRYSALSSRSTSGSTASGAYAPTLESSTLSPPSASHGLSSYSQASPSQQFPAPSLSHSYTVPTLGSQYMPYDTFNSPYANPVSIPSHSPAYTASTIDHRRSSDAPTDGLSPSTSLYSSGPRTSTFFANPYAPQESSDAKATLGLPGRASTDLSAGIFFNTNVASSDRIGHAQYRRRSGVSDEPEVQHFKEE